MADDRDYDSDPDPHIGLAKMLISRVVKIPHNHNDYEDCLQVARIAIWSAQQGYKPEMGTKFSTYVSVSIRNALHLWMERNGKRGFTKTCQGRYKDYKQIPRPESIHSYESDGYSLIDCIEDPKVRFVGDAVYDAHKLLAELAAKNSRMAYVVHCRFFLNQTLTEIGEKLGLSKEWVRQIEADAMKWMREKLDKTC